MNKKTGLLAIATALSAMMLLQACAPMLVAGAATGAIIANDRRTAGTIVDDQGIELRVANKIASDKALAEKVHVNLHSYNRTLLITGEVPSEEMRDQIVAFAGSAEGVKQVYNALDIALPTEYKSRNFDVYVSSKVKAKMVGRTDVDAGNVKVIAENAVIYLMGIVKHSEADAAAQAASEVDGVKRVVKVFEYLD